LFFEQAVAYAADGVDHPGEFVELFADGAEQSDDITMLALKIN
jgi:serine phosphatase RsbU (regulator of sigma subunit)